MWWQICACIAVGIALAVFLMFLSSWVYDAITLRKTMPSLSEVYYRNERKIKQ